MSVFLPTGAVWSLLACWGDSCHILALEDLGQIQPLFQTQTMLHMQKSVFHCTPGGSSSNPSHLITLLSPFLCHNHLLLSPVMMSPCIADGCLLQLPWGKISPKPPWGVFRGQAAWMAANRAPHQNYLDVKRKITTPGLLFFCMRFLLSSDNKNMPDCPLWSCSYKTSYSCFLWKTI